MENIRMKKWYCEKYPEDETGKEINENATFDDLFECLDHYKDVYRFLGVGDSLIRERLFLQLANVMECSYDYIYNQWLMSQ